jgi:hypothetical protein
LKGYKYFEIERDFFNKLGVLIDGDFKFGVPSIRRNLFIKDDENFTADLQKL